MARAPFQVLVLPYRIIAVPANSVTCEYAIFAPQDYPEWQGIAGGGEDGETPLAAAQREGWEEARIPLDAAYMALDTRCSIPVYHFRDHPLWGAQTYVIPEYSFAVDVGEHEIVLSPEHREYRWLRYEEAICCLTFDSNKTALWELQQRLLRQDLPHRQIGHG